MIAGCVGETLNYGEYGGTYDEKGVDPFAGNGEDSPSSPCIHVDELILCIGRSGGKEPQENEPKEPDVLKRGELVIIRRKERPEDEKPSNPK